MNYKRMAEILIQLHTTKSKEDIDALNNELKQINTQNRKMRMEKAMMNKFCR